MNRVDHAFLDQVDGDWVAICQNYYELLTGIILDTRTPLERLRLCLKRLSNMYAAPGAKLSMLDFRELGQYKVREIQEVLRQVGYPWWRQKARYFKQEIRFDLAIATYEQMDSILGIGPKLASLWMRITHPKNQDDFVVIDTHVLRELRRLYNLTEEEQKKMSYLELSNLARDAAKKEGKTVTEWDSGVVERGIRARLARRKQ